MRNTIFAALVALLQGVQKLASEQGIVHVYDWPVTAPAGYPYVVVSSVGIESEAMSNVQDKRRYLFTVQIVGEKFGDASGKSQSEAIAVARTTEDAVIAAIDSNADLGLGLQIIVTKPLQVDWNLAEDRSRIIISIRVAVEVAVNIAL